MPRINLPDYTQFPEEWAPPSINPPSAKPEVVVRPFQSFRERRDQRLVQMRTPPGVENVSELCWGESPQFEDSTTNPMDGGGFNTKKTDEPPEEPYPDDKVLTFTEYQRKSKVVRVENPDDPDQYVMVEDVEQWFATGPSEPPFNGRRFKFVISPRKKT